MAKLLLRKFFLLSFILGSIDSFANQSCGYLANKDGVTITMNSDCNDKDEQQNQLNYLLDFILQHIEKKDKDLKVLIDFGFCNRCKETIIASYKSFAIGDTTFLDSAENVKNKDFYESSFCGSIDYPQWAVDSIYRHTPPTGLYIRFLAKKDNPQKQLDKVLSIVNYAIKNLELIKKQQKYILLPDHLKNWKASVLTFDTNQLKAIETENYGFELNKDYGKTYRVKKRHLVLALVAGLSLISIAVFVSKMKNKRSEG